MLSKEREAKLLKIDFIFDGKQAQIVRDDYLAGRHPLDSSLSAQHSDDEDGESDEDAEPTMQAAVTWVHRSARLCDPARACVSIYIRGWVIIQEGKRV
jgi:hypothetical protein